MLWKNDGSVLQASVSTTHQRKTKALLILWMGATLLPGAIQLWQLLSLY
jgi:hypothetical protein